MNKRSDCDSKFFLSIFVVITSIFFRYSADVDLVDEDGKLRDLAENGNKYAYEVLQDRHTFIPLAIESQFCILIFSPFIQFGKN